MSLVKFQQYRFDPQKIKQILNEREIINKNAEIEQQLNEKTDLENDEIIVENIIEKKKKKKDQQFDISSLSKGIDVSQPKTFKKEKKVKKGEEVKKKRVTQKEKNEIEDIVGIMKSQQNEEIKQDDEQIKKKSKQKSKNKQDTQIINISENIDKQNNKSIIDQTIKQLEENLVDEFEEEIDQTNNIKTYMKSMTNRPLNEQDLRDFKEIRELEKIAPKIQKTKKPFSNSKQSQEIELEQIQKEFEQKEIYKLTKQSQNNKISDQEYKNKQQQNEYKLSEVENTVSLERGDDTLPVERVDTNFLKIKHWEKNGNIQINIELPTYDIDEFIKGSTQSSQLVLTKNTIDKIEEKFKGIDKIIIYTDGSSLGNPGEGGCGVAFYTEKKNVGKGDISDDDQQQNNEVFLFGFQKSLGLSSNNFSEFMGVIWAQILASIFQKKDIIIRSDSKLIVNQIKGYYKCKNVRLVELLKITHALIFKFSHVSLQYVPREQNKIADILSKKASKQSQYKVEEHYKFYFKLSHML